MQTLLPLSAHPGTDPQPWAAVERHGAGTTVVLDAGDGPGTGRDPGWASAIARLAEAGIPALGYVDLGLAARPLRQVRADVRRWAGYPVAGIFFDQAPTTPYLIGPVATAASAARRVGLDRVLLNPGMVPDPLYRDLGLELCVFEGSWSALRAEPPDGTCAGDGYLVHGVPPAERSEAQELLRGRGAGLALLTDAVPPEVYTRLPEWLGLAAVG